MNKPMSFDDSNRLYKALSRALGVDRPHRITLTVGATELAQVTIDRPLTAQECNLIAAEMSAGRES